MVKLSVGIILGLLIGVACRWFDIPVPSPPKLAGALLVLAITVGYVVTDRIIAARFSERPFPSRTTGSVAKRGAHNYGKTRAFSSFGLIFTATRKPF